MDEYKKLIITSPFGLRNYPQKEFHRGVDFRPDAEKKVYSGFTAVVRKIARAKKEGLFIQFFKKINGIPFYINVFHLDKILTRENNYCEPNENIAMAGNTGNSTAIHIHYEIFTYKLNADFVQELKNNIKYHIINKEGRIFFEPFELFDYMKENEYYI